MIRVDGTVLFFLAIVALAGISVYHLSGLWLLVPLILIVLGLITTTGRPD